MFNAVRVRKGSVEPGNGFVYYHAGDYCKIALAPKTGLSCFGQVARAAEDRWPFPTKEWQTIDLSNGFAGLVAMDAELVETPLNDLPSLLETTVTLSNVTAPTSVMQTLSEPQNPMDYRSWLIFDAVLSRKQPSLCSGLFVPQAYLVNVGVVAQVANHDLAVQLTLQTTARCALVAVEQLTLSTRAARRQIRPRSTWGKGAGSN